MEQTTHHGRTTAYWTRGDADRDGPGLLCIHGSGGSHAAWRAQFRLADTTPVTALDLSGHGESGDVDADPGYEALSAYVDDVVAVARAVEARVLVGNSLGGAVALTTALERDLDLDGLVLTGTGARLAVLDDLLAWLDDDFDRAVAFLHDPDRLFHDPTDAFVEASTEAMYDAGQAVTHRDFRTCHTFDVRDRLDELSLPSVAIVGEHDQLTPPWYHEYLAENLPDCTAVEIPDAAHLAMLERPAAFNAAVREFLDERLA
jgi:pimeloyl-ACP methyl ester carboxylesterase